MTDFQVLSLIGTAFVILIAVGTLLFQGGKWVGGVNEHMTTISVLVEEIRQDIKKLLGRMSLPTVAGGSPLRLAELGDKVSDAVAAPAWAEQTAGSLRDRVSGKRPDEIQELCFEYIYDEFQPADELETAISISAYENGIDKEQVLTVLAIVLRDELVSRADHLTA